VNASATAVYSFDLCCGDGLSSHIGGEVSNQVQANTPANVSSRAAAFQSG